MITLGLPQGKAFHEARLALDEVSFILEFSWNARALLGVGGCWFLTVKNADGVILVAGLAIVSNRLLLDRFKYIQGMPAGDFMATDLTGTIDYAQYDQLGTDVPFVYYTAAELAE